MHAYAIVDEDGVSWGSNDSVGYIESRVQRAALLLDEAAPGWAERVDVDRLDMSSIDNCVLGQVFGPRRHDIFSMILWRLTTPRQASGYGRGIDLLSQKYGRDAVNLVFSSGYTHRPWVAEIGRRRRVAAEAASAQPARLLQSA